MSGGDRRAFTGSFQSAEKHAMSITTAFFLFHKLSSRNLSLTSNQS